MCDQEDAQDKRPVELGDVFRMHRESYCKNNTLTPEQHKVINAICNCRTSVLGGHVEQCDNCDNICVSYNSCRNRHCPKCQSLKTAKWLEDRQKELLPIPYFHVVFTLPHELNTLVLYNKKELYSCLMQAVWETIKTFGEDPKRLNGLMGMIAILHTWSQNLLDHNHVHCIVAGGALVDGNRWQPSKPDYLFPVKAMSIVFRGIFISGLRDLYDKNRLKIPSDPNLETSLSIGENFETLLDNLMKKQWVVYSKHPFVGPKKLLDYLGRYVNKIAISNYRILSCDEKSVKFKWRDYSDNNTVKVMTLKPEEFIRRFLMHVVPTGFMRVRFFGFLGNACKKKNVATIRKLLSYEPTEEKQKKDMRMLMLELTGNDITLCPKCKIGHFYTIQAMPNKLVNVIPDTS
ncbi:MAG TPA: IS91 family transposase [Fibrobacteres bacterium]|jgi:hypothetical protein|nr:IS91 family transposase [Fibrobacterota bacterium]